MKNSHQLPNPQHTKRMNIEITDAQKEQQDYQLSIVDDYLIGVRNNADLALKELNKLKTMLVNHEAEFWKSKQPK
jgi:hypothetical protein